MTKGAHPPGPAAPSPAFPPGAIEVQGAIYYRDANGVLVPKEVIKAKDLLEDELVRELSAKAAETSQLITAFKASSFEQIDAFVQLLFERYKAKVGGAKGNITLRTFDGLIEVQVQTAELIRFGAGLQAAKALVDECLLEWSANIRPEIRAILQNAFRVDKEGQVSRANLLALRRYDFEDERWKTAMTAITEAEVAEGSKRYIRFRFRPSLGAPWNTLSLNIATA